MIPDDAAVPPFPDTSTGGMDSPAPESQSRDFLMGPVHTIVPPPAPRPATVPVAVHLKVEPVEQPGDFMDGLPIVPPAAPVAPVEPVPGNFSLTDFAQSVAGFAPPRAATAPVPAFPSLLVAEDAFARFSGNPAAPEDGDSFLNLPAPVIRPTTVPEVLPDASFPVPAAEEEPSPFTPVMEPGLAFLPDVPLPEPEAVDPLEPAALEQEEVVVFPPVRKLEEAAVSLALEHEEVSTGMGMTLCGALLVVAALWCAAAAAGSVMDARDALVDADARVHLGAGLVQGAAAVGLLVMGLGAVFLRRWAAPLLHALSWVVLLPALLAVAAGTALLFVVEDAGGWVPSTMQIGMLVAAGLVFPLGCIACCQRDSVARLAGQTDARVRWTDARPIPVLMVFCLGVMLAVLYAALGVALVPFPWFGEGLKVNPSLLAWTGSALLCVAAAVLASLQMRAAFYVLLAHTLVLAVSATLTLRGMIIPAGVPAVLAPIFPWAGAVALLPILLLLVLSRRSFHSLS